MAEEWESEEPEWSSGSDADEEDDSDIEELDGIELVESLQRELESKDILAVEASAYDTLNPHKITAQVWKKAESNRHLGYTGNSARTGRRKDLQARRKAERDANIPENRSITIATDQPVGLLPGGTPGHDGGEIFTGYASDVSSDPADSDLEWDDITEMGEARGNSEKNSSDADQLPVAPDVGSFRVPDPPPLKRRKLDIPTRQAQQLSSEAKHKNLAKALVDIEKLIRSKRYAFAAGENGLQAYRARAIQSCLQMVVQNGRKLMDASERAAESQGFSAKWGGRLVRRWVRAWQRERDLPVSKKGRHVKVYTLLSDPAICAELRSYVRSNKWSMDPEKLAEFSKKTMIPAAAEAYAKQILRKEIPNGLRRYLEVELFPRIHFKPGTRGISLRTARPNDGVKKSWVLEGEFALKKKGQGRGIHQSDVICSTVGWLAEASQSMDYGKNYDGYWNGALFVKQLQEKIIPAFERAHGPGYQALIMVDNSQGHSAYAEDALLASRMNLRSGGKQARLRDGWFVQDGKHITQQMNFPPDHPKTPGVQKVKRYLREHCDYTFGTLKENLPKAMMSVGLNTIRRWDHPRDVAKSSISNFVNFES
ncbi:hypothetical protein FOMPIDRAFT_1031940 [Fomitopsis schrenkii]|uniref:DDE-1 domain-containing protein n=1 Tax=Fomitopsis schrenkii TaxID=2126942 RepID=S8E275_FOMSC|nr:hypothetical protein FOMPIDRAFT_1031940 [Fomitopsis schrenkii]